MYQEGRLTKQYYRIEVIGITTDIGYDRSSNTQTRNGTEFVEFLVNADYVAATSNGDNAGYTAKPQTFRDIWKDQNAHKFAVQPPAFGTAGAGLG